MRSLLYRLGLSRVSHPCHRQRHVGQRLDYWLSSGQINILAFVSEKAFIGVTMSTQSHSPAADPIRRTPLPSDSPRYLHLLWDEDIERLHGILAVVRKHHREVLELWYQLYTIHFGEVRTLSEREFGDLYGRDLHRLVTNLLTRLWPFAGGAILRMGLTETFWGSSAE